ncbi:MAG: hypothetical protein LBK52_04345, partial [Deltaproteobacteria bacterium]|nr:hypothetical protein [Deltaproteobacteria bacterium]
MLVRVIYTVISFTFLFFLLTLVLGFWGRQILGLFRIRKAGWGEPLTLAAGLGLAVFLAQAASPLVSNFRNLWQAFYFIGLFGALAEAVRFYVRDVRLKEKRLKFLRQEAGRLHTLWASLILAAVLSFAYSVIWPSGRLDIWADTSADFYSWIFASEYLAGGIKANVLDLNPSFQYTLQDAFGTLNIIGFASQAYQRTPLLGSSHVLVTLLVWWGTAVFVLVRKCFGLRFRLSLLLALGLILGWLPNYLSAFGMFGHLAAMTALVTALEQLIPEHKDDWPGPKLIRRLFFPLLVLFLSYQSGYLPGILVLILFGSLQAFGQAGSRSPAARTGRALLQGIRPILWLTLALALIMPGSFYHLTARLLENSARISGWILPLFSPRIFSGLPYYPRDFYYHTHITETNQISFYFYIPFILIIFFLLY